MKKFLVSSIFLFASSGLMPLFAQFSTIIPDMPGVSNAQVGWADYDQDNDLDLALFGDTTSSSVKRLFFCKNTASGFSVDTSFLLNENNLQMCWGDVDNDNDPDLLTGGATLRLFLNTDSGFVMSYPLGVSHSPRQSIGLADFDNDGYTDIQTGGAVFFGNGNSYSAGQYSVRYFETASSEIIDFDEDGDLDVVITGDTIYLGYSTYTCIYRNNGNRTFTSIGCGAIGAGNGDIKWADFDQDGDWDFAVLGRPTSSSRTFKIYRNNVGVFTDMNAGLSDMAYGSCAWGDFNNDGYPDLAYCGTNNSNVAESKILINNGGFSFSDAGAGLLPVYNADLMWGDYDNDGDIDLLTAGTTGSLKTIRIYQNGISSPNLSPVAPAGLNSSINHNDVILSWNWGTDVESLQQALTYSVWLYNDTVTAFNNLSPLSDTLNGKKYKPCFGFQGQVNWASINNLNCGTYIWRVQTIDAAYAGSPFSVSDTFLVNNPISPLLDLPLSGTIGVPPGMVTSWHSVLGASTYQIQVDDNPNFSSPLINDSLINSLSYQVNGLLYNTTYYWRVRGNNLSYDGDWSSTWTFITRPNHDLVEVSSGIKPMEGPGEAEWIDYDMDHDYDLLMTGDSSLTYLFSNKIRFYKNSNGILTESPQQGVVNRRYWPHMYWSDYDMDGDQDFLIMTFENVPYAYTQLYDNNGGVFTPSAQQTPQVTHGNADWGDYDNDGDPDLLICGYHAGYARPLTEVYMNVNGQLLDAGFNITPLYQGFVKWVDVNDDGYLDIVMSGDTATGAYHRITKMFINNTGLGFTETVSGLEDFYQIFGYVASGDLDNDGDVDLVITGDTLAGNYQNSPTHKCSRVYLNNSGYFTLYQVLGDSINGLVDIGDLNNDGLRDIVLSGALPNPSHGFRTAVWLNTGAGFIKSLSCPSPWTLAPGALALGDIDNDNDLDLVISGTDSTITREIAKLYLNVATNNNTAPQPPTGLSHSTAGNSVNLIWSPGSDQQTVSSGLNYAVSVGTTINGSNIVSPASDLQNGFRYLPVIGNAGYNNVFRLQNLTNGRYYWRVQSIDASGVGSIFSIVDSFNVRVPDIPELSYPTNHSANVPLSVSLGWLSADSVSYYELQVALDSSFTQLLFSQSTLTDTFYNWQSSSYFTRHYWRVRAHNFFGASAWSDVWHFNTVSMFQVVEDLGTGYSPSFADYDSDGDLDLLILGCVSCADSIRLCRNDSGSFVRVSESFPNQISSGGAQWGDYDSDGDPDLVLFGATISNSPYNPITKIYQNNNGALVDINASLIGVLQGDADWVDFDGDGDIDLSLHGRTGASGKIFQMYKNNAGVFVPDMSIIPPYWWSSMDWGDYDNDGDYDLGIAGNYEINSVNYWVTTLYRNDSGTMTATNLNLIPMSYAAIFKWVDLDNDGDIDISLMGSQPSSADVNLFFINNGGIFSQTTSGFPANDISFSDWADYDNDGDMDCLLSTASIGNTNAISSVYINQGGLAFSLESQAGLIPFAGQMKWFDYDNDGDHDIICVDSSYHFRLCRNLRQSNNFITNTRPTIPAQLICSVSANTVFCSWTASSDAESPASSLTYNILINKIGDTGYVVSPLADTVTGKRYILDEGNTELMTSRTIYYLDSGAYVARVQSIDNLYEGSLFSSPVLFQINSPLMPALFAPSDSTTTTRDVNFQWIGYSAAQLYQIQIAFDSVFNSLVYDNSSVSSLSIYLTNLPVNAHLYWRVRMNTSNGWSIWSDYWVFDTRDIVTNYSGSHSFCPYDSTQIQVSYLTGLQLQSGNIISIELSDASGSFSSAQTIGAIQTTSSTQFINGVLPPGLPPGNNYRIRAVASSPYTIGADNGTSLVLYPQSANATITAVNTINCIGSFDTLSAGGYGYTNLIWSTGDLNNQIVVTNSAVYGYTAIDTNGCIVGADLTISFNNCSFVWPGDANEDLIVSANDLLPIGVHYGALGYARDTITNLWTGHNSIDWGQLQSSGMDVKYTDSNGDGTVDNYDTTAIVLNYGNTHTARYGDVQNQQTGIPVFLQSSSLTYSPGSLVSVFVHVGSLTDPAQHVYGGDFELAINPPDVQPGSVSRTYIPSWLGNISSDLLSISHFSSGHDQLNFAICRFDHTARSGYGPVLELNFTLDSMLEHGDTVSISLPQVLLIDSIGQPYLTSVNGLDIIIDTTLSTVQLTNVTHQSIQVFPNPFAQDLNLLLLNPVIGKYEYFLTDLLGNQITPTVSFFARQPNEFIKGIIPADLPNGMYILVVRCGADEKQVKLIHTCISD